MSALRIALMSGGGFLLGYFLPTLAFMIVYFVIGKPPPPDRGSMFDNTMLVLYLAGVYALVDAIVFAAIMSASRNWRARPKRQVGVISAVAGVVAQLLNWTGLALFALVPLMPLLPRNASMVFGVAMPGLLAGVAVLIWSSLRPPQVTSEDKKT